MLFYKILKSVIGYTEMVSFKIILGVLFGLLVAAIAVLGILSYQSKQAMNDTANMIRQTHRVLDIAEEISSLSKDIQLESNGVFINRDTGFIKPYYHARSVIIEKLDNLRFLTKDEVSQQEGIDSLEYLLHNLIAFGDSALLIYSQLPELDTEESELTVLKRIRQTNYFRANIRAIINNIKSEEKRLLLVREEANQANIQAFDGSFFQMLVGMTILLLGTFFAVRYNFNKRILAEKELKSANELFVKLFHESPIGLVICRADNGVILDCNKAYAELINYSKDEIIGNSPVNLRILESEAQREKIMKGALETGVVRDVEVPLQPRDKEMMWVSISMQAIQVQNKKCLMAAILDLTAHKNAEEKIKKALASEMELNKMKSNFVSMASHEFRTPLTTILSSAFLLEKHGFGEKETQVFKHLGRIKSSVNNLTSILDEFLSVTKIEEGKIQPRIEQLNLKDYLEKICLNFKTFAKPGQNIIYNHEGDEHVYSDPVLLESIINNLVSNAIKYSPEGTEICVSSAMNGSIHLKVKDSGIGIPMEDQKHLFERFYRASNAGTVQGTGLGLHIMKHYVDMLKGSIEVTSEIGRGTEVQLTFESSSPR